VMQQRALFRPLRVGNLELANRIVIAPMCQYSAENGCMNDWHLVHLGQFAFSGAVLLTIEAAAVLPEGRITYADPGRQSFGAHCRADEGRTKSVTNLSIQR
jgi:2,4-dienoyl-CoA reductase-like NADH-dependent reductase (Old Yellow Enzyme family)